MKSALRIVLTAALLLAGLISGGRLHAEAAEVARSRATAVDVLDWPTYNYDEIGTRHNSVERTINVANAPRLEEKWRFPPTGSPMSVGAIHTTPVVVNGYVYFGTATRAAVYKLAPDGSVKWVYRPGDSPKSEAALPANQSPATKSGTFAEGAVKSILKFRERVETLSLPTGGFVNSVLVSGDLVFVADLGGNIYCLDRETGKERWKIDTRARPFPGAHTSNCIFAAPILADGKIVVAGGGYEHSLGANPLHRCCSGRGFVVALEPESGEVVWKYEVGPEPRPLDPPVKITDAFGEHVFHSGPSTSSVWCTPSYDAASQSLYFGTDAHNASRQPTKDDPRLYNKYSCALIAIDARSGREKWVTQISADDVWNYASPGYDAKTGRYKDQSIGDTPKIYTIEFEGKPRKVVGAGCKNGGFYVLDAESGERLANTPIYTGPPVLKVLKVDPRTLALPSVIGGLQTGCATDGKAIFTNGIDNILRQTAEAGVNPFAPPTGGRVVSISLDTTREHWRHERPKVKAVGGSVNEPLYTNVGDPVGSGIALANGVAYFTTTVSNRLVALDISSGKVLREIELGPVWCGPSVSRGRVYVGTGNILFLPPGDSREAYFAKSISGTLYSFGLPGEDAVSRMGKGNE